MSERRRTVPVHGGECVVDPDAGELRLRQSRFRHMHPLVVLATALLLGAAMRSLATDWQYVAHGRVIEW